MGIQALARWVNNHHIRFETLGLPLGKLLFGLANNKGRIFDPIIGGVLLGVCNGGRHDFDPVNVLGVLSHG